MTFQLLARVFLLTIFWVAYGRAQYQTPEDHLSIEPIQKTLIQEKWTWIASVLEEPSFDGHRYVEISFGKEKQSKWDKKESDYRQYRIVTKGTKGNFQYLYGSCTPPTYSMNKHVCDSLLKIASDTIWSSFKTVEEANRFQKEVMGLIDGLTTDNYSGPNLDGTVYWGKFAKENESGSLDFYKEIKYWDPHTKSPIVNLQSMILKLQRKKLK